MAIAPSYDGIAAGLSFREGARIAMRATFEAAFSELPLVLRGDDTRSVHAMRDGLRRLRAAMRTFATCFPKKKLRAVARDVRRIARKLEAVRDADVALAGLRAELGGATERDRIGIAYAIEEIAAHRRAALAAFAIELSQIDRDACAAVLLRV